MLLVLGLVRGCNLTRIDVRSLTMWNGCCVGRLWTNRSYVHIACIWRCYWCLMQYDVVISLSCAVQIRCNGDGGSALMFVCWMFRTVTYCPWTNSVCVCVAWVGRCYGCLMQYEVVIISPPCAVQIHYNGDDGFVLIFVCWMSVSGWPWTNRLYVCITACVVQFGTCCWCSMQYEVVINLILMLCCPKTLKQCRWLLCIDRRWFNAYMERVLCWPCANSMYVYL